MLTQQSTKSWEKIGRVFEPQGQYDWVVTHAMLPTVLHLKNDLYRVYFSGRDMQNRSLIGFIEVNLNDPLRVLKISPSPVLGLGQLGCFDDNGVTPSWAVRYGDKVYLYYIGWNRRSTVRMSLITGLAISTDGGETFSRHSRAPLLSRTDEEPFSILTAPCVMKDADIWRMWYVSGVEWVNADMPRYNVKYAESEDGINWRRDGTVCIDLKSPGENALARPCVLKEGDTYKMWYAYKGEAYRIGYADSVDGIRWIRKDEKARIGVSQSGWDSQMIEYAFVFNHKGKKHMFYNGNEYGKDGIGYAVL